jgi:FkbM family methyltransferase
LVAIEGSALSRKAQSLRWTKRRLRAILARPAVSRPLTAAVRPLASGLSVRTLLRLPVARDVEIRSALCAEPIVLDAAGRDPIASLLYWRGIDGWEPETLPVFLRLVTPGATVVDVGANTGLFSLLAARRHHTVAVHAIEPVPRVYDLLSANVLRNGVPNVSCHRLALSDREGTVSMYVPREDVPIMASMLPDWREDSERVDVAAQSLDSFVRSLESRVDVLKVDTEGTEPLVLAGGLETLARHRPFVICEVLAAGRTADDLTALMTGVDYEMFRLEEDGPRRTDRLHGNEAEGCRNYLFVPHERALEARELTGMPG